MLQTAPRLCRRRKAKEQPLRPHSSLNLKVRVRLTRLDAKKIQGTGLWRLHLTYALMQQGTLSYTRATIVRGFVTQSLGNTRKHFINLTQRFH